MKIKFKIIALLSIILLLSISYVYASEDTQADTANLQTTDDFDNIKINDANEINTTKTRADFNSLIKDASDGDTIELDSDYDIGQVVAIDKKITLDGKGHTLDGKNTDRILTVKSTDITLQNIVFKNAKTSEAGGAIFINVGQGGGAITIKNCTFIDNQAQHGSALYTSVGGNEIINCTFSNNIATQSGGAISINGNNNIIKNNIFTNNKATSGNGGAIVFAGNENKNNNIIGNTFTGNSAGGDGGAFYLQKGSGDQISDNQFIRNTAKIAGAVSLYETGYSNINNNEFIGNSATNIGGAIRETISDSTKKTTISNNTFKDNTAANTGAIHIDGSNVEINANKFDGNKATQGYAGSIQVNGNTVNILNNNIVNTNAKTNGGAIVVKTGTSMTIKLNNITNANANSGGAIHVESGAATIDSNNFTKCSATYRGGAIKSDTKVTVTQNTFKDNTAKDKGSDVFIYNGDGSQVKSNDFTTYTANSLITYGNVAIQDNKGFKETLTISTLNKNYATTTTTKYLTVVLKNSKGTGVSGKNLTITLNGVTYTGVTDGDGKLKVKIAISAVNSYPCTVKFAGDDSNNAATNSFKLNVNKATTKITSPAKTFKKAATKKVVITLKSGSKLLAKKKVTLTINKKTYKATTNSKGKVTINIKLTKKGTFKGTLKFGGDKTYAASTGKVTIKIK